MKLVCDLKAISYFRSLFGFSGLTVYGHRLFKYLPCSVVFYLYLEYIYTDDAVAMIQYTRVMELIILYLISFYTEEKYLFKYYEFDKRIDNLIYKKQYSRIPKIFAAYIVFCLVSLLSNVAFRLKTFTPNFTRFVCDLGRVPLLLIIALYWLRFKIFCENFKRQLNVCVKLDIRQIIDKYDTIQRRFNEVGFLVKIMVLVFAVFGIINMIIHQYRVILIITAKRGYVRIISSLIRVSYNLVVTCTAAALFEITSNEFDQMKHSIVNKIITTSDERQKADLRQLLQYFTVNPMNYSAFSIIPLNMRFPLKFLSLSVNYFILLLQLTFSNESLKVKI